MISPEQLVNQEFVSTIDKKLMEQDVSLIVRKEDILVYVSPQIKDLSKFELPAFGEYELNQPVHWMKDQNYNVEQHDFFFLDGAEGTIFLIRGTEQISSFQKLFLPLRFIVFLLILITTCRAANQ